MQGSTDESCQETAVDSAATLLSAVNLAQVSYSFTKLSEIQRPERHLNHTAELLICEAMACITSLQCSILLLQVPEQQCFAEAPDVEASITGRSCLAGKITSFARIFTHTALGVHAVCDVGQSVCVLPSQSAPTEHQSP